MQVLQGVKVDPATHSLAWLFRMGSAHLVPKFHSLEEVSGQWFSTSVAC